MRPHIQRLYGLALALLQPGVVQTEKVKSVLKFGKDGQVRRGSQNPNHQGQQCEGGRKRLGGWVPEVGLYQVLGGAEAVSLEMAQSRF